MNTVADIIGTLFEMFILESVMIQKSTFVVF